MKRILIFILIVLVFATSIDIVNAQFLNNEVKDKKLIDIQGLETLSVDNLDQEVVFEDEDLKKQIMEKLNIDENIKIKDMSNIEEITLTDISSLVGLEHASNLQILDIMNSELNLDVIVNLSNL